MVRDMSKRVGGMSKCVDGIYKWGMSIGICIRGLRKDSYFVPHCSIMGVTRCGPNSPSLKIPIPCIDSSEEIN